MSEHIQPRMKISLITVCRNSGDTIEDTIKSVAGQTYGDIEYIIVDGASTDGTLDVIRGYEQVITRWVSEPDKGTYDAMNKGLSMAVGEITGFLNADDILAGPTVLEQVSRAFSDVKLDACYADLVYVDKHDLDQAVRYWKSSSFSAGAFSHGWCPAHPTFYARRSVYDRLGGFDMKYELAADAELLMRFLEKGGISSLYVPDVWVKMRLGGQTNCSIVNIFQQNREILSALRSNGLAVSPARFALKKFLTRIKQRYYRPDAE